MQLISPLASPDSCTPCPYQYICLLFRASREPQDSEVHPVHIHQFRYQPAWYHTFPRDQLQDRSDSRRPVLFHRLEGWRVCLGQYPRVLLVVVLRVTQMQFHLMHPSHPTRLVTHFAGAPIATTDTCMWPP